MDWHVWNRKVAEMEPYKSILVALSLDYNSVSSPLFISPGGAYVPLEVALDRLLYVCDRPVKTPGATPQETIVNVIKSMTGANIEKARSILSCPATKIGVLDAVFRTPIPPQEPDSSYFNPTTNLNYKTATNFKWVCSAIRIVCNDEYAFRHHLLSVYGVTADIDSIMTSRNRKDPLNLDTLLPITNDELRKLKHYHVHSAVGTDNKELYYRILPSLDATKHRKTIPKAVKVSLWDKYYPGKLIGPCYTCGKDIDARHFEAGHVVPASEGGPDTVENLRPICKPCNASMSNMNLYAYKERYHEPKSKAVKEFMDEAVIVERMYIDRLVFDTFYRVKAKEITTDYKEWCTSESKPYTVKDLDDILTSKGCTKETDGVVHYVGVRLLNTPLPDRSTVIDGFNKLVEKYRDGATILRDLRRLGASTLIVKELVQRVDYPLFVVKELRRLLS